MKMNKEIFRDLLRRYLADDCSDRERLLVEGWYDLLGEEKQMPADDFDDIEQRIWERVKDKTFKEDNEEVLPKIVSMRPWYRRIPMSAAASLVLLVAAGLGWFYWTSDFDQSIGSNHLTAQNVILNDSDLSKDYWLADSSKVTLFPNSSIEIPMAFAEQDKREVYLKGEAVFDVTKNPLKPFLVHTGEVVTRVIGTSFKIVHKGKSENVEVAVLSGKVSVYNKNVSQEKKKANNGVVLTPNQKVVYHTKKKYFKTEIVENPVLVDSKKENPETPTFIYKDTPIETVLKELEKNYGIQIIMAENERFSKCPLTANLSKQNLFNKLELICASLNATFEVKGTTILVNGLGCN